jgi:hypothetical protein
LEEFCSKNNKTKETEETNNQNSTNEQQNEQQNVFFEGLDLGQMVMALVVLAVGNRKYPKRCK